MNLFKHIEHQNSHYLLQNIMKKKPKYIFDSHDIMQPHLQNWRGRI